MKYFHKTVPPALHTAIVKLFHKVLGFFKRWLPLFWPEAPVLLWAWHALGKTWLSAVDFQIFINDMLTTIAGERKMKMKKEG